MKSSKLIKNKVYTALQSNTAVPETITGIYIGRNVYNEPLLQDYRGVNISISESNENTIQESEPLIFAQQKYKINDVVSSASGVLKRKVTVKGDLHYGENLSKNIYAQNYLNQTFGSDKVLIFDGDLLKWAEKG